MDIDLYDNEFEFNISKTGILQIKLIRDITVIGNICLHLDDNDLMGLLNILKDYFKR